MKIKLPLLLVSVSIASIAYALQPGIKIYEEPTIAPEFSLTDIENKTHTTSNYKNSVLIVNFWATWCIPCRKEIPLLKEAWKKLKDKDIHLIGIATKDSKDAVQQFKIENNIEFPLPLDEDGSVAETWSVIAVPTAYVIDPDGHITMRIVGGSEWNNPKLIESIIALKTQTKTYK
jgi:peroxiredoxin